MLASAKRVAVNIRQCRARHSDRALRDSTALSTAVGLHGRWRRTAGDDATAAGAKGRESRWQSAIERNAETQNLFREVNERVAEVYAQFSGGGTDDEAPELIEIFCECGP